MRILLLSDIHANLVALETVLRNAGDFDQIWCLGDVVGYGPDPNECIKTLRAYNNLVCVAGNHDWAVLDKVDLEEFNPDARRAVLWTRDQLDIQNLDWLHSLPDSFRTDHFTLTHGSPRYPIWEYVLTPATARVNFEYLDTPIGFIGHTHVPVIYRYHDDDDTVTAEPLPEDIPVPLDNSRLMINPGSVGQPRDGDARAAFAILDFDTMTLMHHRIEYNILATQLKMGQANLPMRLITRLSYGW
ncbi:MAG: metallophosphatase family protein [Anaerolineae bacterium]|nr:metallophosphatase family protein [Anaerolineae bacterium]